MEVVSASPCPWALQAWRKLRPPVVHLGCSRTLSSEVGEESGQAEHTLSSMPISQSPATHVCVSSLAQRDFADVIVSNILSWGDDLQYPGGLTIVTRVLVRERRDGHNQRRSCEDASIGQHDAPWRCRKVSLSSWKGQEYGFSLQASRRNTASPTPGY